MERLESSAVRPRQARYQAALRPDWPYATDFTTVSLLFATAFKTAFLPLYGLLSGPLNESTSGAGATIHPLE